MDAKPTRALMHRDENAIAMPKHKSLHSRTKSSPALIPNTGALKLAPKRAAFGDISYNHRGNRSIGESLTAQNDKKLQEKKVVTVLEAAQKPLPTLSNSANVPLPNTVREFELQRNLTKRATTIFRDYSTQPKNVKNDKEGKLRKAGSVATLTGLGKPVVENKESKSEASHPRSHSQILTELSDLQIPDVGPQQNATIAATSAEFLVLNDREVVSDNKSSDLPELVEEARRLSLDVADTNVPKTTVDIPQQNTTVPNHFNPEIYVEDVDDLNEDDGYITAQSFRSGFDNLTGGNTTEVLKPKLDCDITKELDAAMAVVELFKAPEDVEDEAWDIGMVSEYKEEIFEYFHHLEIKMAPNPNYMTIQTEIQWPMRSVLIDWIVQVHDRFQLLPETLYLTINIIDRFLSVKVVSINKLQLVGAVALFIAAKYEEVNCPTLKEMVFMVDNSYEEEEILKAERFMLGLLHYDLSWPGPMSFLRRISTADDYDLETRTVAKYFLELTIMDERFLECPPSFLAAGAHCLSILMLNKGHWSPHHVHYSGYTFKQLYPLLLVLHECLSEPRQHHSAIYDKYCSSKFRGAAGFAREEMLRGFRPFDQHTNRAMTFDFLYRSNTILEYVNRNVPGYHGNMY